MHSVGIRDLKAHLGTYIGYASHGEEVVVTDRGREVALLVPITPERRVVMGLVAEGTASWQGGKPVGLSGVSIPGELLAETIVSERQ
jgi:prevent-host-death family protein